MAKFKNIIITYEFLDSNPTAYFIFGDNLIKKGYGGAAKLRDHPHALGFITKKFPDNDDSSFYRVDEYKHVFYEELHKLHTIIKKYPDRTFYISKLGEGLANRYNIWENLIQKNLLTFLKKFDNVVFCWDEEIE
jgi:hypothetical protein